MNNFVGDGVILHHIITANVSSGDAVQLGSKVGIAVTDGSTGDLVAFRTVGVHNIPLKTGGGNLAMGTVVALDPATGEAYGGAVTVGDIAGFGYVAENGSTATDTTVAVKLTDHAQVIQA